MKKIIDGIKQGLGIMIIFVIFGSLIYVIKARNGADNLSAENGDKLTTTKRNQLTNKINNLTGNLGLTCTTANWTQSYGTWTYGAQCNMRAQCPTGYVQMGCVKKDLNSITKIYNYEYGGIYPLGGTSAPGGSTEGCSRWMTFSSLSDAQAFCTNGNYGIQARCCKLQ